MWSVRGASADVGPRTAPSRSKNGTLALSSFPHCESPVLGGALAEGERAASLAS